MPPKAKKAKLNLFKSGVAKAREGDAEAALSLLKDSAEKDGHVPAYAPLAQIYAFNSDWPNVIKSCANFLKNPSCVYAGNVGDHVLHLLMEAGLASKDYLAVEKAAKCVPGSSQRLRKWAQEIVVWAQTKGASPRMLYVEYVRDKQPRDHALKWYNETVAKAKKMQRFKKGGPEHLLSHCFALASGKQQLAKEAVAGFEELQKYWSDVDFKRVCEYAVHLLNLGGHEDDAWEAVSGALKHYFPVDPALPLPSILLIEPVLSRMLRDHPARRNAVLCCQYQ